MSAHGGIMSKEVYTSLDDYKIFITERLPSSSRRSEKFIVTRESSDGLQTAFLRIRIKSDPEVYGESKYWTKINHKNFISLIEKFSVANRIGYLCEYCSLGSLSSYVESERNAGNSDCLQPYFLMWTKQLMEALLYLERHNLYHQNICPKVLLLDSNKNLKIGGLGAVRTSKAKLQPFISGFYHPTVILHEVSLNKLHTWMAGAALFHCFTGKYIGTTNFCDLPPDLHQIKLNIINNVAKIRDFPGLATEVCTLFRMMLNPSYRSRPPSEEVWEFIDSWPDNPRNRR